MVDTHKKILMILVSLSILLTSAVSIILIFYVATWNYILIPTYEISTTSLNESGLINEMQIEESQKVLEGLPKIYNYMDYIFLLLFISTVLGLPIMAYFSKREGYSSIFGMLTLGSMILIFLTGLSVQISRWIFDNLVTKLMPTLANTLPLYNYYINNAGWINALIFAVCVLANFLDFDELKFMMRKKESQQAFNSQGSLGGDEVV